MPVPPTTKQIMAPPFCVDSPEQHYTQEGTKEEEDFEFVDKDEADVPSLFHPTNNELPNGWPGYDVSDKELEGIDPEIIADMLAAVEREEGLYRGYWNSSPMDRPYSDSELEKGAESPRIDEGVVWDKGVFQVSAIPIETDCKRQRHYIARQEELVKEINVWERVTSLPLDQEELFPLRLSGKIQMDELSIWIQASLKSKQDLEKVLKLVRKVVGYNQNPRLGGDYRVLMHVLMITQNTDYNGDQLCLRRRQKLESSSARSNENNVFESTHVSSTALQGICERELLDRKDTNLFAPWLAMPLQTSPSTILSRISAFFSGSRNKIQPPVPADVYIIRKGSEVIQPYSRLN